MKPTARKTFALLLLPLMVASQALAVAGFGPCVCKALDAWSQEYHPSAQTGAHVPPCCQARAAKTARSCSHGNTDMPGNCGCSIINASLPSDNLVFMSQDRPFVQLQSLLLAAASAQFHEIHSGAVLHRSDHRLFFDIVGHPRSMPLRL